ncbi:DUF4157 domain-containing protein [Streptomyces sp. RP5T]|uniref:eCIS core domain-containing protein n=1 Tax=Streptomyces sp. RP5T TaxID=2490848 RepID=UPI000F64BA36|nr:DUF4157 domain-containing protein [Streptomyces sp. RP5T]RRR85969.1 DUF4157 domain-containing protein [Streptomyces sp. RP5T]
MSAALADLRRLTGQGDRVPPDVLDRLGRSLATDLSALQVHTGPDADRAARAVDAEAFACGSHVFFRDGAYRPDTTPGFRLLAHEAAHVVQQARAAAGPGTITAGPAERDAQRCAELLARGRRAVAPGLRPVTVEPGLSTVIQRHSSYEHRALGEVPVDDLVAICARDAKRDAVLDREIRLFGLWRDDPLKVDEQQVEGLCPWIRTLRLGKDNVLATYGELNALPDYLPDAPAFDSLPQGVLIPILQVIRQQCYNKLTLLRTGNDPNVRFARAACEPWQISQINNVVETTGLDELTRGMGVRGENHYQGLLARNACHFAPFSWYRWQTSHLIARDLAKQAHERHDDELARRAWKFAGYADHFLQDSFAAGHLINKTLIMQWFIEWVASTDIPVADWDFIKDMTTVRQPGLAGRRMYEPGYPGPSDDPQTAQEALSVEDRVAASRLVADPTGDLDGTYQRYLLFLSSAAAQLASANLHDYYNNHSLWVASPDHQQPYEVWGDATLLTGGNGSEGVRVTGTASRMSREAIRETIEKGATSITTQKIRDQFPTQVYSTQAGLQTLEAWNDTQRAFCADSLFPAFKSTLEDLLFRCFSPRLGVVSRDQELATVWCEDAESAGYNPVSTLTCRGRVFAGSNGYVYEIDPVGGHVLRKLLVTDSIGAGDYDTRLATDGTTLFVGVHGYVYGVNLQTWGKPWYVSLKGYAPASVLFDRGRLYAGSNGYVYEIDPVKGSLLHQLLVTDSIGAGDYDTRLATDGTTLFVGVHGYVYGVNLQTWGKPWYVSLKGYAPASVLFDRGRLYAGSNGYVYEIDPVKGSLLHQLLVTDPIGAGDYDTRLATDGTTLFVGVHGYVYGVNLQTWKQPWYASLHGYERVSLALHQQVVVAGSNGYVYEIDPKSGVIRNSNLLTYLIGAGNYDTRVTTGELPEPYVYAGVHGYDNKVLVNPGWHRTT